MTLSADNHLGEVAGRMLNLLEAAQSRLYAFMYTQHFLIATNVKTKGTGRLLDP